MAFVRKVKASLVRQDSSTYIGEDNYIFFDIDSGIIRMSDGTTPGGLPVVTQTDSTNVTIPAITGADFTAVQDQLKFFHSSGLVTGGVISDNGDGSVNVSAGHGYIRLIDDPTEELYAISWDAEASLGSFTENVQYWVTVTVSGGNPLVTASNGSKPSRNTAIILGSLMRNGSTIHIYAQQALEIGDHARLMIDRLQDTLPFSHVSGCEIGETGTRNFSLTTGKFWEGLTPFSTAQFDSSGSDTFTYYYSDGAGGWTAQTNQTQINNTQYDDGSGTLASLTASNYGVHWVYLTAESESTAEVYVIFGSGDYSLQDAQDATPPSSIPPWISFHSTIVGKIIIEESASSFTSVQSTFAVTFSATSVTSHDDLLNNGIYTHADIDTHIDDTSNPHSTSLPLLIDVFSSMTPNDGDSLYYDNGNSRWDSKSLYEVGAKRIIQDTVGTVSKFSGTTDIILSASAPNSSAGTQIVSQAFTPAESTSEIVFNVSFTWSVANSSTALTVAVFRDTTCVGITVASAAGNNTVETFNYSFIDTGYAADTPVTYTVRVGRATGSSTWYINQTASYPTLFNDIPTNSLYRIQEVIVR